VHSDGPIYRRNEFTLLLRDVPTMNAKSITDHYESAGSKLIRLLKINNETKASNTLKDVKNLSSKLKYSSYGLLAMGIFLILVSIGFGGLLTVAVGAYSFGFSTYGIPQMKKILQEKLNEMTQSVA